MKDGAKQMVGSGKILVWGEGPTCRRHGGAAQQRHPRQKKAVTGANSRADTIVLYGVLKEIQGQLT
jgi:hypothetical protein